MRKHKHKQQPNGHASRFPHPLIISAIAIFIYILYLRVQLMIQSDADVFNAHFHADKEAHFRKPLKKFGTPVDVRQGTDPTNPDYDVRQLAESLTKEFSADDGIPSDERMDFNITFSDPTTPNSSCVCDVVSTDCLHTIACIPDLHNPQRRNALVWLGIQLRRAIKTTSTFDENFFPIEWNEIPLGKMLQYHTIEVWKEWRTLNTLPEKYNRQHHSIFVEEELYPTCMQNAKKNKDQKPRFQGISCFYRNPSVPEDFYGATIENEANRWFNVTVKTSQETMHRVSNILEMFLRKHHPPSTNDPLYDRGIDLFSTAANNNHFSARGNLMMFAHIMRIMFNRRGQLDVIYREKVTFVETPGSNKWSSRYNDEPFIVSVHMRRGDSCGGWPPEGYRNKPSSLDSRAQTGGDRECYKTGVYLDAIRRIRTLVPKTRPLHVHLATDDAGDVINEIIGTTTADDNVFGVDKWHFLNYSRSVFDYDAQSIEGEDNRAAQPILGETAVADLWHLSHGHAMVGHLGSRFGKTSWYLATARWNDFIPFFSVDGHSVCCEIDEACGDIKPYVTVENCLSFGHEYGQHSHEDYFEFGSLARKNAFLEREKGKKEKG